MKSSNCDKDELAFRFMDSSQGKIAYIDSGDGYPLVFVHGNSCSSKVFHLQLAHFSQHYRVIAIDLPGHGQSERARYPDSAYTIPGYAKLLEEVTQALRAEEFVVVGFSLGGNIALQWSQITSRIRGIMMISSAPMNYSEEAFLAYPPYEGSYAACPDALSESQAKQYMGACGYDFEDPTVYFMIEDAMKTDGASRAQMVASVIAGKGVDESRIVSQLAIPLALVLGSHDSAIGREYVSSLPYRNLWHNQIEFIKDAQHAIVIHQAEQLNGLLDQFVLEVF